MRKPNLLEEEGRERGNKWVVYCVIIVGVLIGAGIFVGVMSYILDPIIDNYTSKKDIVLLYDFYDNIDNNNQTVVYFLGNSIVGSAIYPPGINDELINRGYNIRTYNLYMSGDSIVQRVLQINTISNTSPSLIIYGVTYSDIAGDGGWIRERATLVQNRINVSDAALTLLHDDELKDIVEKPDLFSKKQYIISAFKTLLLGGSDWTYNVDYTQDPRGMKSRLEKSASKNYESIVAEANDVNNGWHPEINNTTTRSKEALIYNIQSLENSGIPVIIINMPLHPLISEKITNESRHNYFNFLNSTGAKWIDMETTFGDEYFYDSHHATWNGTQEITPYMVDLIIQEVKNGVIHNS